eukprot:6180250-Pleurochrysis_carterae.AAC.1
MRTRHDNRADLFIKYGPSSWRGIEGRRKIIPKPVVYIQQLVRVAPKVSDAGVGVSSEGSSLLWTCCFCQCIKPAQAARSDASVIKMAYSAKGS